MSIAPVMFDLNGLELTQEDKEILKHPLIGGVILFTRNYESPEQLQSLTQSIREIKSDILIAVDQEGGRVQRFQDNGFTRLPPMGKIGNLYDDQPDRACQLAETCGWLMASEVLAVGVDFSFAPVLDLSKGVSQIIGDRAFHRDAKIVAKLASHFIDGMHRAGMAAVGKHFPGHGSVALDSHLRLPVDSRLFEAVESDDLQPFAVLTNQLEGVMPAHILFSEVDGQPVGFSKHWLQTILRQQLHFNGAIISDDLSMKGAVEIGDALERASLALGAGCDMIIVCNDRPAVEMVLGNLNKVISEKSAKRLSCLHRKRQIFWQQWLQNNERKKNQTEVLNDVVE